MYTYSFFCVHYFFYFFLYIFSSKYLFFIIIIILIYSNSKPSFLPCFFFSFYTSIYTYPPYVVVVVAFLNLFDFSISIFYIYAFLNSNNSKLLIYACSCFVAICLNYATRIYFQKIFFHILPKPRTYFHGRLMNGTTRIFSYILCWDWESNSCQFSCTSLKDPNSGRFS